MRRRGRGRASAFDGAGRRHVLDRGRRVGAGARERRASSCCPPTTTSPTRRTWRSRPARSSTTRCAAPPARPASPSTARADRGRRPGTASASRRARTVRLSVVPDGVTAWAAPRGWRPTRATRSRRCSRWPAPSRRRAPTAPARAARLRGAARDRRAGRGGRARAQRVRVRADASRTCRRTTSSPRRRSIADGGGEARASAEAAHAGERARRAAARRRGRAATRCGGATRRRPTASCACTAARARRSAARRLHRRRRRRADAGGDRHPGGRAVLLRRPALHRARRRHVPPRARHRRRRPGRDAALADAAAARPRELRGGGSRSRSRARRSTTSCGRVRSRASRCTPASAGRSRSGTAWTPDRDEILDINSCGFNGTDTVVAVYTGASVDALTEVASNDDDDRRRSARSAAATRTSRCPCAPGPSTGSPSTTAVGAGNGAVRAVRLAPRAARRLRRPVRARPGRAGRRVRRASRARSRGEPAHDGVRAAHSVWAAWTAQRSGRAVVEACGDGLRRRAPRRLHRRQRRRADAGRVQRRLARVSRSVPGGRPRWSSTSSPGSATTSPSTSRYDYSARRGDPARRAAQRRPRGGRRRCRPRARAPTSTSRRPGPRPASRPTRACAAAGRPGTGSLRRDRRAARSTRARPRRSTRSSRSTSSAAGGALVPVAEGDDAAALRLRAAPARACAGAPRPGTRTSSRSRARPRSAGRRTWHVEDGRACRRRDTRLTAAVPRRTAQSTVLGRASTPTRPARRSSAAPIARRRGSPCVSPVVRSGLSEGDHRVAVRAVAGGVADADPGDRRVHRRPDGAGADAAAPAAGAIVRPGEVRLRRHVRRAARAIARRSPFAIWRRRDGDRHAAGLRRRRAVRPVRSAGTRSLARRAATRSSSSKPTMSATPARRPPRQFTVQATRRTCTSTRRATARRRARAVRRSAAGCSTGRRWSRCTCVPRRRRRPATPTCSRSPRRSSGSERHFTVSASADLAEGALRVRAERSGPARHAGRSGTSYFAVDVTAPAVAIASPADGAFDARRLDRRPGSGESGGERRRHRRRAGRHGRASARRSWQRGAGACRSPALPEGDHVITARQTDAPATSGSSAPRTIHVDRTAPRPVILGPAEDADVPAGPVTLHGEAGVLAGDARTVALRLRTQDGADVLTRDVTVQDGSWSTQADLPPGSYVARVSQADAAQNSGEAAARSFSVSDPRPTRRRIPRPRRHPRRRLRPRPRPRPRPCHRRHRPDRRRHRLLRRASSRT